MTAQDRAWLDLTAAALHGAAATAATAGQPIYRRLYRSVVAAVLDGRLRPGARLPSTRSLAAQLGVARGTVETAYQMLAAEGYVVSTGAAGTFVNSRLRPRRASREPAADPSKDHTSGSTLTAEDASEGGPPTPLAMGVPALDAFPSKLWTRLASRRARELDATALGYRTPAGVTALRHQIAAYLAVARGITCSPEQVIVTSGFQGALGLLTRSALRANARVYLEDPGYPSARQALRLAGATTEGVPVDEEGLRTDLLGFVRPADAVLVTPSHHYPLGHALSVSRRAELLSWAAVTGAWIIEDDYDSEYRYAGPPLPSLKSLDVDDRVIYLGTFSKVLSPALRLGYLVAPAELAPRLAQVATLLQPAPAPLVQDAVARFLYEGHLGRHVRRMRRLYAERRDALRSALADAAPMLELRGSPGGMHLTAFLPAGTDDVSLVAELRARGLAPSALSECGAQRRYRPGLLMGFCNLPSQEASGVAVRLAAAVTEATG